VSHTALIRLGAIATSSVLESTPTREYRELYRNAGLRVLDGRLSPYVCVDHDKNPIGRVRSLFAADDYVAVNGKRGGKWLMAHVDIERAPGWLSKDTRASISYAATWKREVNGWLVIEQGLLREVSILSPGKVGAEPHARVVHLERSAAAVPSTSDRVAAADSSPLEWPDEAARRWAAAAPLGTIRRVGVGQVLGVR
jgi:hypothetical protein